jgi:hypothetical protein
VGYNQNASGNVDSISLQVVSLPTTTTVALDPSSNNPSTYGQSVTFDANVTVNGNGSVTPTGTVAFFDGNPAAGGMEIGTAPLDSQGNTTSPATQLHVAGSPHQVYAVYNPDPTSFFVTSTTVDPVSLTVNPASLTVAVNNATKVYGAPLPAFTFSYNGFQNNDGPASLTTGPSINTIAAQFSSVNSSGYSLTPQGAVDPDYTFTYMPGTLTVTPATLTASLAGTVEKTYDGTASATLSAGNYQLLGVLNHDAVSLNDPTSGTYDSKNVGTGKTVTVPGLALSGAAAGNYQLASTTFSGPVGEIIRATLTASLIGNQRHALSRQLPALGRTQPRCRQPQRSRQRYLRLQECRHEQDGDCSRAGALGRRCG